MHVPHDTHTAPVLGAYFKADAAAYYRLAVPLRVTGGAVVDFWRMEREQVQAAETVVIPRMANADAARSRGLVALLKRDAGRVLIDADDDHAAVRHLSRATRESMDAACRAADAVVTTNTTLAGRLRRLNRDVRVLPNYINAEDWPVPAPRPDGPPVVVLAGSATHADDWRPVAPALRRIVAERRAVLRVCGFLPDYLRPLCADFRPWAGLDAYPAMLAGAALGLCPLPGTAFNRCKSPVKLFEYALSGAAVVASPCQYGPILAAAGMGAAVVPDGGDWYDAIRAALSDAPARAASLRSYVLTHHSAAAHAATIRAAYAA
jgi:hypothetical protein